MARRGELQSVLVKWTHPGASSVRGARRIAEKFGSKPRARAEKTSGGVRFRQRAPSEFRSFRTFMPAEGVVLIYGRRNPKKRAAASSTVGQRQLFPEALQDQRQLTIDTALGDEAVRKKLAEEARKRRQTTLLIANRARGGMPVVATTLAGGKIARTRQCGRASSASEAARRARACGFRTMRTPSGRPTVVKGARAWFVAVMPNPAKRSRRRCNMRTIIEVTLTQAETAAYVNGTRVQRRELLREPLEAARMARTHVRVYDYRGARLGALDP